MLEELEAEELEFETVGEFLAEIKKEFGGEEEESVKAAELRKLEQGGKTMEEFVQEFKRTARESGYKRRLLIKEFKRRMNRVIRRKLMEAKNQPSSIEQWYRRTTALNRNWRESRQEEERLKGRKEHGEGTSKQKQRQILPQLLMWQRRQIPSQQVIIKPAPMKEVERMNVVIVREQGQGMGMAPRRDPLLSRSLMMDLIFIFISYFIFSFSFLFFSFSIFRTAQVRVISHTVTSVTT